VGGKGQVCAFVFDAIETSRNAMLRSVTRALLTEWPERDVAAQILTRIEGAHLEAESEQCRLIILNELANSLADFRNRLLPT
jgi:hypothetical protein